MQVNYKNDKLQQLLNSLKELSRKFGEKTAKKLIVRRDLLSAVNHLGEVPHTPPVSCHELKGDKKGQFSIYADKKSGVRIVFIPDHDPIPVKEDTGIALNLVTEVEIIFVGNYHDD